MNRKSRAKSSSLFLLELILAILFFSIASAVCVQIFVKSHVMSNDAQALNLAINECSGAAEAIAASKDEADAMTLLQKAYPEGSFQEKADGEFPVFTVYYDEDLQPCSMKAATYEMTIVLAREGTMLSGSIEMRELGRKAPNESPSVYQLDVTHHLQRGFNHE